MPALFHPWECDLAVPLTVASRPCGGPWSKIQDIHVPSTSDAAFGIARPASIEYVRPGKHAHHPLFVCPSSRLPHN